MPYRQKMKGVRMWAVLRGKNIYLIRSLQAEARREMEILSLAGRSKEWAVKKVMVTTKN